MRLFRRYIEYTFGTFSIYYLICIVSSQRLDCVVDNWGSWSKCSKFCSIGESIRNRTVIQEPNWIFAKPCPSLKESKDCGEKKKCEYVCNEQLEVCQCQSGYELDSDHKSCRDIDECFPNNGLGPCHHKCKNLNSTYKCSCHDGFILAPNKHSCFFENKKELCSPENKHFVNGTCVCSNQLHGVRCDRNETLCKNVICEGQTVCSSFIHTPNKCVKKENQLSLLLEIPYSMYNTEMYKYKVDLYLEALMSGIYPEIKSLTELNIMKQIKSISKKFYVEGTHSIEVTSAHTYVKFIVFEFKDNKYREIEISAVCDILSSSHINCMGKKDCEILQNAGYECPLFIYKTSFGAQIDKLKKKSFLWLYCLLSIVAVIGLVGYVFKFKKLKKRKNENPNTLLHSRHTAKFQCDQNTVSVCEGLKDKCQDINLDKCNGLYGEDSDRLYESIDNLSNLIDTHDSAVKSKQKLVVDLNCHYDVPKKSDSQRCNDSMKYTSSDRYTDISNMICPTKYENLNRNAHLPK